jgi:oligoribonuclease
MSDKSMVWVDLEMTGLDIDRDTIIEMACLITDDQLNIIAEGPNICINHPESVLTSMCVWSQQHHDKSGLTSSCRESKFNLQMTEDIMLDFVAKHVPKGKCPLAGNSVHCDKKFLDKYMPKFMDHLHYRIIDVSTVKELCRRWYPSKIILAPRKSESHRALDDIKESIEELKYYRTAIFRK